MRHRTKLLQVRLTPREHALVRGAAAREGVTLADFARCVLRDRFTETRVRDERMAIEFEKEGTVR